jgi:hypothetical protein
MSKFSSLLFQWTAETVAVGKGGEAYLPVEGGDILASSLAAPGSLSLLARMGGRPIGVVMHPDGYLVVCDAVKGLLAVDLPSGTVRLLTNRVTEGNLSQVLQGLFGGVRYAAGAMWLLHWPAHSVGAAGGQAGRQSSPDRSVSGQVGRQEGSKWQAAEEQAS